MKSVVKLAPYNVFGKLRLAKWFPDDEFLEETDSFYQLIHEGVRGVDFLRSMEFPNETFNLNVWFRDADPKLVSEILSTLNLSVVGGESIETILSLFGEPTVSKRSHLDRNNWLEFVSEPPEPYLITGIFEDGKGLTQLSIRRLDITPPQSQEEMDSPPSQHRHLDNFEASPENVQSPESLVSWVSVSLQSVGNFHFRIHMRPQRGVVIEGASLHIRRADSESTTTILWLRGPVADKTGQLELDGYLDKDLVRRSHVVLTTRDEANQTSQNVIVEFDRFYGKLRPD